MIGVLLGLNIIIVSIYAVAERGSAAIQYIAEPAAMLAFAALAGWTAASRKWRSLSASMGLLTGAAALVDISGGLTEMHFSFFVVILVLTLYEEWAPFLLAVAFVLIHHGVMGTIDPSAVFDTRAARAHPWTWAGIHALFISVAGAAGVTAWGLNERVRDRMREVQRQLEHLGLTDALTGLGNRRRLIGDIERLIDAGRSAMLTIFDLDGFKEYNDRFGHPAGDALLVRLTAALQRAVTQTGSSYRLGGDEFCVLAEGVDGDELDGHVSEWTGCFGERGEGFSITASSGVALIPEEADTASDALRLCDQRMYARKHSRRTSPAAQTRDVLLATLAAGQADSHRARDRRSAVAERVGAALGLGGLELQELGHAADLRDIGEVAVPATILTKPGPLTEDEWEFVRRHPVIGERILAAAPALAGAGSHRARHPRALRRHRLSRPPHGRRDPARGPHHLCLRRLSRDDQRASVSPCPSAISRPWTSCGAGPEASSTPPSSRRSCGR